MNTVMYYESREHSRKLSESLVNTSELKNSWSLVNTIRIIRYT